MSGPGYISPYMARRQAGFVYCGPGVAWPSEAVLAWQLGKKAFAIFKRYRSAALDAQQYARVHDCLTPKYDKWSPEKRHGVMVAHIILCGIKAGLIGDASRGQLIDPIREHQK